MERDLNGTDHSIPVLALCQLPYNVEKRDDKRRQLVDLSGVGTIELDVDAICLMHVSAIHALRYS
jgi:replicative DNA helicase